MNFKTSTLAVWACLVLMAPPALAQVVSDPVSNRNYQIQTSVTGYTPGQYVSGTNEWFQVSAWASGVRYTGNQQPWTKIYLTEVMILINGTVVKDWTNANGDLVQSKGFTVHWDSTQS